MQHNYQEFPPKPFFICGSGAYSCYLSIYTVSNSAKLASVALGQGSPRPPSRGAKSHPGVSSLCFVGILLRACPRGGGPRQDGLLEAWQAPRGSIINDFEGTRDTLNRGCNPYASLLGPILHVDAEGALQEL